MPRRTNSRAALVAAAVTLATATALAAGCSAQPIDSNTNNAITPGPPLPGDMTWPSHAANYRPGQLPLTPSTPVTSIFPGATFNPGQSSSPTQTSPAISPVPGPSSYANRVQSASAGGTATPTPPPQGSSS